MSQELVVDLPPNLRLVFFVDQDRWHHRFDLVAGDSSQTVLTSVEGTGTDDFPTSPPLQDMDPHDLQHGPAVLGVGMAGKGHWSASFSTEIASEGDGLVIKCDLACLQKHAINPNQFLGSTYLVSSNCKAKTVDQGLSLLQNGILVVLRAGEKSHGSVIRHEKNHVSIRPTLLSDKTNVSTRWQYEIG